MTNLLDETEEKLDIDMTDSEIEDQCDELFKVAPIEFRPRKFNQIDQLIANLIDEKDIVVPILYIQDNIYLVGSSKVILTISGNTIYV